MAATPKPVRKPRKRRPRTPVTPEPSESRGALLFIVFWIVAGIGGMMILGWSWPLVVAIVFGLMIYTAARNPHVLELGLATFIAFGGVAFLTLSLDEGSAPTRPSATPSQAAAASRSIVSIVMVGTQPVTASPSLR